MLSLSLSISLAPSLSFFFCLVPSLSFSQTVEGPNQSCTVNIKVLLWQVTGSHRTADCCTPTRGWFTPMTTVFQSWITVFGRKLIFILSYPLTSNLRDPHILLFFDKQLSPRHFVASFSLTIFLASILFLLHF